MYYQCSKNKGADQLRGYSEADLRQVFVFAYAKSRFSHRAALLISIQSDFASVNLLFQIVPSFPFQRFLGTYCNYLLVTVRLMTLRRLCGYDVSDGSDYYYA